MVVRKRGILFRFKAFCIFSKTASSAHHRKMPEIKAKSMDKKKTTLLLNIAEGSRIF